MVLLLVSNRLPMYLHGSSGRRGFGDEFVGKLEYSEFSKPLSSCGNSSLSDEKAESMHFSISSSFLRISTGQ